MRPLVLEAGAEPVSSWPHYYDSLTLFSPARYSALPGLPFPGDPEHYPHRDEVVDYLRSYAAPLDTDIRTGHRVAKVAHDNGFRVTTDDGTDFAAPIVIAATGGFGRPHRPALPGLDDFPGTVLHAAQYRSPEPFHDQRVILVGAGNSAVQIAAELADHAQVTLATRKQVKFSAQRPFGRPALLARPHRPGPPPDRPVAARRLHHPGPGHRPLPIRTRPAPSGPPTDVHRAGRL
ncbi:flavin-containing monooxygenase [Lentzea guizhouensis]|uniref:flavin-containing monooxygenase n=1 Tax=Lentzea guizhouensis TaxID=1586287 RepID=UPI000B028DA3